MKKFFFVLGFVVVVGLIGRGHIFFSESTSLALTPEKMPDNVSGKPMKSDDKNSSIVDLSGEVNSILRSMSGANPINSKETAEELEHKIEQVTVYSDLATISRGAQIKSPAGVLKWIRFGKLPDNLDPQTLQVRPSAGTQADIIQVVVERSFERIPLEISLTKELKSLEALYGEKLELAQRSRLASSTFKFLNSLRFNEPFPKDGSGLKTSGGTGSSQSYVPFQASLSVLSSAISEVNSQTQRLSAVQQKIERQIAEIDERIEFINRKINSSTLNKQQRWVKSVNCLVLLKDTALSGFELKYDIPNAKWYPVYDVRADLDGAHGNANIKLVIAGLVEQHTTENWSGVNLSLSSLDHLPNYNPTFPKWLFTEQRVQVPRSPQLGGAALGKRKRSEALNYAESAAAHSVAKDSKDSFADMIPPAPPPPPGSAESFRDEDSSYAENDKKVGSMNSGFSKNASDELLKRERKSGRLQRVSQEEQKESESSLSSGLFPLLPLNEVYPALQSMIELKETTQEDQRESLDWTRSLTAPAKKNYSDSNLPAVLAAGRQVEFRALFPVDLGHDEAPIKIPLTSQDLKAKLTYLTIPKRDPRVFLKAEVKNGLQQPILGGKAQIFMNGDLITKTQIGTVPENAVFDVTLGVDPNVVTQRVVERLAENKGLLKKEHKILYKIRFEIANHHDFPINLELQDQYPVANNEDIKVEFLKASVKPTSDTAGILKWVLNIPAQKVQKLEFSYSVTHPEDFLMSGID